MTPFKFYFWFATLVEWFPLIPLLIGLTKWRRLSLGIKFFFGFLASDLILNKIGDYFYYLKIDNLFLHYYYAFFQNILILLAFWCFFELKKEKLIVLFLIFLCNFLLLIDFVFVSKSGYNYMSGFWVALIICMVSGYYFSTKFSKIDKIEKQSTELNLTISLIIILQFFIKFIDAFLEKYLLETTTNTFLWLQVKDIYYFFMLICLVLYTYALYTIKTDET